MYWNNHNLRIEHSQTPNQLWIISIHQNIDHETIQQIIDASSTNMSLYGVEMNPNIRFIGERSNNIILPRTPLEKWVTINSMDLTSNDGNFVINIYLKLCTYLEGLHSVREYFQ